MPNDEIIFEVVDDDDESESYITEVVDDVDFSGDPQTVLSQRLTPKALRRLDEMIDSPDLKIAEKAIEKIRQMVKRLQQVAAAPTMNVLSFDPAHLAAVFGGMKEMLTGGERDSLPAPERPRQTIATVDDPRVAR